MKIAIHHSEGSFSERWIKYCESNNIEYKLVNAYQSDIIEQVKDCDGFMWHHFHNNYRDALFAKQLLYSLEKKGISVFPNYNTTWHFDDKVGQKYLFESLDIPSIPSFVFYNKQEALNWINNTTFPKVFKLRGGAGASNVKLVRNKRQARKLVKKAFSGGFPQYDRWSTLCDRVKKWLNGSTSLKHVCAAVVRLFISSEYARMHGSEKGYAYFQEFIPNNTFDIRVCIVDNKAFAIKRMTRKNDFRASGSGNILYSKSEIDERCITESFNIAKKLNTQSLALDFVFNGNTPLLVEISYGFAYDAYDKCEGYWTEDMKWHKGECFDFCGWMVENVINNTKSNNKTIQ